MPQSSQARDKCLRTQQAQAPSLPLFPLSPIALSLRGNTKQPWKWSGAFYQTSSLWQCTWHEWLQRGRSWGFQRFGPVIGWLSVSEARCGRQYMRGEGSTLWQIGIRERRTKELGPQNIQQVPNLFQQAPVLHRVCRAGHHALISRWELELGRPTNCSKLCPEENHYFYYT